MQRWTFIFFIITTLTYAQKEANIWYFGEYAGLDFNSGNPVLLTDGQLFTYEGCATICDNDGNLQFYTDGITVYNKNHLVMPNGNGLAGNSSSTHSAIIVPNLQQPNLYYVFTIDTPWNNNKTKGLQYSEVDMSLNNGLGDITTVKNVYLDSPVNEKVIAILNSNLDGYWVVSHRHNSDEFIAYEVTASGVNPVPVVSAVGSQTGYFNITGQIKISPNGNRLAVARGGEVQSFDFDNVTGKITNPKTLNGTGNSYGIEFSPNGNLLYVSYYQGVSQFNLNAGLLSDINNSKVELISSSREPFSSLQLGPDGKIYVAKSDNLYIDIISNPNILGVGCNYMYNGLYLEGRKSHLGLPTFVSSFFYIEGIDFENTCIRDTTKFALNDTLDSVIWNFDDPASGVNNTSTDLEPTHIFTSPGTYEVTVTATIGTETATETTTVTIYQQPIATKPYDIELCDLVGDISFDLEGHGVYILNGLDPNVFGVNYYEGMVNYTNGIKIDHPEAYTNSLRFFTQEIIAEVYNKQNPKCTDITEFNVGIYKTPELESSANLLSLTQCDDANSGWDTDRIAEFDLTAQEQYVLLNGTASEVHYNYFTDAALTLPITTPSSFVNTQNPQTIYVEGVSNENNQCKTSTSFMVEVLELPLVTPVVELKQCDDDLDGFSVFNLNEVISEIKTNTTNEIITFYENQTEANLGNNPITNITTYTNEVVSSDIIWGRIENSNQCFKTAQINLIVSTTQIPSTFTRDFYKCDDDIDGDTSNGISAFDFSILNSEIENLFPSGQQLIINYYRNQSDALAEQNSITDISNYRNEGYPNIQDIYIRVDSAIDNDCLGLGHHITLHVEKQPTAYPVIIPEQCDDDGDTMYAFDTSTIEATLLNAQTGMTVSCVDELGNPLSSPLPNPFLTASQTITARVTNATSQDPNGACSDETTIAFNVDAAAVAYTVNDIIACDDDSDGLFPFDTTTIESTVLNGQTGMMVIYTDETGNTLPSPLPNPFLSSTQTITARVENPLSNICYDETTFKFVVVEQPILNMNDTWLICEGDSVDVIADEGYGEYLWSTGEVSSTITVYEAGTYQVTATNIYENVRCETSKTVTVIESNIATITDIETKDWTQNDNEITIFVEGLGDYEYSIDGVTYQEANTFNDLKIDNYTVYVRDKNGCGVETKEVFLMYYPKYFTPNNDGQHDTWHIYNSNLEPNTKIYIYDRYGKLVKQLNPNSFGWDGTINGQTMPTSDYWFVVYRQNGKQYKGHFTLKR